MAARSASPTQTLRFTMSKARRQIGDQSTKGAALGLCVYGMVKQDFDPMLIALLVPIISTIFAWISTKIGDPELACLFIDKPNK